MNIISVDLNWSPSKTARIAVAIADKNGNVRAVSGGLSDNELLCLISEVHLKKSTHSLILLDIPIEGCKYIGGGHFRPVDLALIRNGFPLLPSSNAGQRGRLLKKRIQTVAGKNARIYEIYPYAVYKFLSYLSYKGILSLFSRGTLQRPPTGHVLLDEQFLTFWPPKYK
ncbi:MAG TPA: hypothetical protein ACFYD6_07995 [Candidatus Brocadiia bacterium]|nr:hypothetical protein [Candidatus Brocadiales bacterium]